MLFGCICHWEPQLITGENVVGIVDQIAIEREDFVLAFRITEESPCDAIEALARSDGMDRVIVLRWRIEQIPLRLDVAFEMPKRFEPIGLPIAVPEKDERAADRPRHAPAQDAGQR